MLWARRELWDRFKLSPKMMLRIPVAYKLILKDLCQKELEKTLNCDDQGYKKLLGSFCGDHTCL